MYKAFGIINTAGNHIHVEGLQDYRPIGAFSFLGRYRTVDFPISNMSNSGIDRIQLYTRQNPRSLVEHVGTGRHYNINSKSGGLQLLFSENNSANEIYNTDIAAFHENLVHIERMHHPYVVIAPPNMIYTADFGKLLESHIESGADITLLYHTVDNAKEHFLNCDLLNLNRQKGVHSIEKNRGNAKSKHVFMDTYIMKKDLFISLINKARKLSSMYTLAQIVSLECENLDVRGIAHRGFFAAIHDFKSYYDANMTLIDYYTAKELFNPDWPIYTKTNNSSPTHYHEAASVKTSVVANGCQIEGAIENSVIGRGCIIKEGAVVRNSVILANTFIDKDVLVENQVIDKRVKLIHVKEIKGTPEKPGYVRRDDTL